jgi:beta-lactam-binding protein with PASTA domain
LPSAAGRKPLSFRTSAGLSQQQARLMIENAGFQFGSITQQTSDAPRGAVIGSAPAAGETFHFRLS